ncbi:transmembrane protein 41B-like [Argonauta hians]
MATSVVDTNSDVASRERILANSEHNHYSSSFVHESSAMSNSNAHALTNDNAKKLSKSKHSSNISSTTPKTQLSTDTNSSRSFVILGALFLTSIMLLVFIYLRFPNMDEEEKQYIRVPQDIADAKNLGRVLSRYRDKYFYQVLAGYFIVYIFLQSFAIPGSIFLSILSGFLFSFPLALFLVCLCSAIGASFCYLIADFVGHRLVEKYWPARVADWQAQVASYREHLLNYIIFLRITPFLPNWFINIAAPVINVPLKVFFLGTFIGVGPPSFVAIQAGTTLHELTSSSDTVSWTSIVILTVFACLSLLPVLLKRRLQRKID